MDYLLWNYMKIMFEPHVEDEVWKLENRYKVLEWKLYDSCGVHFLRMQSMQIYMLVEKKYPLTPPTLSMMLEKKLQIEYESEMAYQLCKFDGKADEGFFVGYSLNSKAFRVFNSRTRIVEENFHIKFSESTPNVVGSEPDWLFDINALTKTLNYEQIVTGTQANGFAGTKASDNAGQARKETEPVKNYILLPLWTDLMKDIRKSTLVGEISTCWWLLSLKTSR
ncbi:hypothetical protein Tco_1419856 [Tanacetum coccineum]